MPVKQKKPEKFKKKRSTPGKHKAVAKKRVIKKKKEVVAKPPTVVTEVIPSDTPIVSPESSVSGDQEATGAQMSSDVATAALAMAATPETKTENAKGQAADATASPPEAAPNASASVSQPIQPESTVSQASLSPQASESVTAAPAVPIQGEENVLVNPSGTKSSKKLVMLIVILILLLAAAGGEVHLLLQLKQRQENATQNPATATVHKPVATPTPTVDVTKYTITVLNGSGIPGEAAKVKDLLTKDGFSVSDVGNATNSAFTNTIIQAKTDMNATVTKKLKDTLSTSYQVAASISALPAADTGDIIVIVGSTKQENQ